MRVATPGPSPVPEVARAAIDELGHTQLALEVARELGAERVAIGRLELPEATTEITPQSVARSTLRDGCIAETRATLEARREARTALNPIEQRALQRIADDEERHAELAFATLAWLVATFGAPVREALHHEVETIRAALSEGGEVDVDGALAGVVMPCLAGLLAA